MSRKKISVVGADYRAHYPRLYALTLTRGAGGGGVVSKSNYRVTTRRKKKGVQRHFRDAIMLKRLVQKLVLSLPFPLSFSPSGASGSLILYFYRNSAAVKRALAHPITAALSLSRRDSGAISPRRESKRFVASSSCNKIFIPRGNKRRR